MKNHDTARAIETAPRSRLSPEEIRRRVADFEWYHCVELGAGVVTPGLFDLKPLLPLYGIPESLRGKTVLDIGPGHGFFAFEFERRGAAKVVTAELPSWVDHDASPTLAAVAESVREAGEAYHRGAFGFAIEAVASRVERRFCNVYDLTPERVGMFDFVFCGSVLQHLSDPLRALWAIRRVCRGVAIICTGIQTNPLFRRLPLARFVGHPNGHAFWLPTMRCLGEMAIAAGFSRCDPVSTFRLTSVDKKFATPHGVIRALVTDPKRDPS